MVILSTGTPMAGWYRLEVQEGDLNQAKKRGYFPAL
jgi:hypothetical protein